MYAKVIKWFSYALMAAVLVITVICAVKGMSVTNAEGVEAPTQWTSLFLYTAYAMAIIPILIIVVLGSILGAKNNPKGLIALVLFAILIVAVCVVTYYLVPASPVAVSVKDVTDAEWKLGGTALYVTYIALGGVILSLIAGGVYRLIKG